MQEIRTNTTSFKKALKTITDVLTTSELKLYDVGIGLMYEGNIGTLLMEHPTEKLVVSANFDGEETDESVDTLFYMGELLDDFKQFRKKEPLFIRTDKKDVVFSVEDGMFFRGSLEEDRIRMPLLFHGVTIASSDLVDTFNYGQAVTKTTFDESTMTLHIKVQDGSLQVQATNFAQLMVSTIQASDAHHAPYSFSLSAKLITKVRNIIERGKSKETAVYETDDYIVMQSNETMVAFEKITDRPFLDVNLVLQASGMSNEAYTVDYKHSKDVLSSRYKALRTAEDERNDAGEKNAEKIWEMERIYLSVNGENFSFTTEPTTLSVHTRDLYNIWQKMKQDAIVLRGERGFVLRDTNETRKTDILVPTYAETQGEKK